VKNVSVDSFKNDEERRSIIEYFRKQAAAEGIDALSYIGSLLRNPVVANTAVINTTSNVSTYTTPPVKPKKNKHNLIHILGGDIGVESHFWSVRVVGMMQLGITEWNPATIDIFNGYATRGVSYNYEYQDDDTLEVYYLMKSLSTRHHDDLKLILQRIDKEAATKKHFIQHFIPDY
jgi:hypothetical protein